MVFLNKKKRNSRNNKLEKNCSGMVFLYKKNCSGIDFCSNSFLEKLFRNSIPVVEQKLVGCTEKVPIRLLFTNGPNMAEVRSLDVAFK